MTTQIYTKIELIELSLPNYENRLNKINSISFWNSFSENYILDSFQNEIHMIVLTISILLCVNFVNGVLPIICQRIGNEISYIGFNRSRNEDNSTRLSLVYILLNFYTITHDIITPINLGSISCYGI